jgi:hypothetical protein
MFYKIDVAPVPPAASLKWRPSQPSPHAAMMRTCSSSALAKAIGTVVAFGRGPGRNLSRIHRRMHAVATAICVIPMVRPVIGSRVIRRAALLGTGLRDPSKWDRAEKKRCQQNKRDDSLDRTHRAPLLIAALVLLPQRSNGKASGTTESARTSPRTIRWCVVDVRCAAMLTCESARHL